MLYEIDTHALIKRLIATNFTEAQAEEVVKIAKEIRQADLDVVATKRDLKELEMKLTIRLTAILGSVTISCATILGIVIAIFH